MARSIRVATSIGSMPRVSAIIDRFELLRQQDQSSGLGSFLAAPENAVPEPFRSEALCELIAIDLEYRWRKAGSNRSAEWRGPKVEEYLSEFPDIVIDGSLLLTLIKEEYRVRCRWGDRPSQAEFCQRFPEYRDQLPAALSCVDQELNSEYGDSSSHGDGPETVIRPSVTILKVRCPHCHSLVQVEGDSSFASVVCHACGSDFSLVDSNAETRVQSVLKTLGHFQLLERLGQGAFGEVWKARDQELDRTVAIKLPRKGVLTAAEAESFLREARAAAQLKHPNIVSVHEVGRQDDTVYIVSDLVKGVSLADWLTGQRPTVRQAAELCRKVAQALHHAHEAGIVHRDLKPANIMLDNDGEPHVMDFGLARRDMGDVTVTIEGQILGTPAYMSPEQARGDSHVADRRTDVYSIGVILFEMLTGECPFRGNLRMMIHQVINDEAPSPRRFNNHVTRDLETICLKCLEKNPDKRYLRAQDLADDLTRFSHGEAVKARPITQAGRAWRWCLRNPVGAGLIATSLMSMLLLMIGLYYRGQVSSALTAVQTAEQLARTQQYYSAWNQAREARAEAAPAWTWDCLEKTQQAISLRVAASDPQDLVELRSLAAQALSSFDIRPHQKVTPNVDAARLAYSPDGQQLAVGEYKAGQFCAVHLVDLSRPKEPRVLSASAIGSNLLRFVQGTGAYADAISSLTFTPDGRWVLAGTRYGMIHAWDIRRKSDIPHSWKASEKEVANLACSPDGKVLYSSSGESNEVRRWSLDGKWNRLAPLKLNERVQSFAVSHNGRFLAVASDRIHLFDVETLTEFAAWPALQTGMLLFSPDDQFLAASIDRGRSIQLVHVRTGKVCQHLHDPEAPGAFVGRELAFTDSGAVLLAVEDELGLRAWDVASGKLISVVAVPKAIEFALAVCPGSQQVAVGSSAGTHLFELRQPLVSRTIAQSSNVIRGLTWANGDRQLSTMCFTRNEPSDTDDEELSWWNPETGDLAARKLFVAPREWPGPSFASEGSIAEGPAEVGTVAVSQRMALCATTAATRGGNHPRFFAGPKRPGIIVRPAETSGLSASADAAAHDGQAVRLSKESPQQRVVLNLKDVQLPGGGDRWWCFSLSLRVTGAQLSGTAVRIVTDFGDDKPRGFDVPAYRIANEGYHDYLADFDLAKDISKRDRLEITVQLPPDAPAGQEIWVDHLLLIPLEGRPGNQKSLLRMGPCAFAPDGQRLWGIVDETGICAWNVNEPQPVITFVDDVLGRLVGDAIIRSLDVGSTIVVTGARRGIVQLHSRETGVPQSAIEGPGGSVQAVALDPDEQWLAMGTELGRLRIWDLRQSKTVVDLEGHTRSIETLAFDGSGEYMVSGSKDKSWRLWRRAGAQLTPVLAMKGLTGAVLGTTLNQQGTWLAVRIEGERAIRVWNLQELRRQLNSLGMDQ